VLLTWITTTNAGGRKQEYGTGPEKRFAMDDQKTIRHADEFYAHALALEREAVERYGEFARHMADLGNDAVAAMFARLSAFEAEHVRDLEDRTVNMALPELDPGTYAWLDAGAPESAPREWLFRLMTGRDALTIALRCERRAQAFFEKVANTAASPEIRLLAVEMANEETAHIAWVEQELERTPEPLRSWCGPDA
jgi:rubrerythrin